MCGKYCKLKDLYIIVVYKRKKNNVVYIDTMIKFIKEQINIHTAFNQDYGNEKCGLKESPWKSSQFISLNKVKKAIN